MQRKKPRTAFDSLWHLTWVAALGTACAGADGELMDLEQSSAAVVNGEQADITDMPWQVSIHRNEMPRWTSPLFEHRCGGTIIGDRWILTAAHCVEDVHVQDLLVFAGITRLSEVGFDDRLVSSSGGQRRRVSSFIVHPDYVVDLQEDGIPNDLALIQLDSPLDLTGSRAKAIRIGTFADAPWFEPNLPARISGWGRVEYQGEKPNVLRTAEAPVLAHPVARDLYGPLGLRDTADQIPVGSVSSSGVAACHGDSGGPLVVKTPRGPAVVGVTSWVYECNPIYPTMFTRVPTFARWIAQQVGGDQSLEWILDTNRDGSTDRRRKFGSISDRPIPGDYDGDGKADFALLRDVGNQWEWIVDTNRDGSTDFRVKFGTDTDSAHPGDYNGDGVTDFAVTRVVGVKWQWIIDTDHDGKTNIRVDFGDYTDRPIPGDYNGDGITDLAVLRKLGGRWEWRLDTDRNGWPNVSHVWGSNQDIPVPADYDGDGITDLAVVNVEGSQWKWTIRTSRAGQSNIHVVYGNKTDFAFPADYNNDGIADLGLLRVVNDKWQWIADTNFNGVTNLRVDFGKSSDLAVPADYDGDGRSDLGLVRIVP